MEGLRGQALSHFCKLKFVSVPSDHELITLESDAAEAQFSRTSLPLPDILELFEKRRDAHPPSVFRLVTLHIIHPPVGKTWEPPTLNAEKDDIIQLWCVFNLDPTALHLLYHGIRGLNQFPPDPLDATAEVLHFMFNSYTYCVIWAFCPRTRTTSGVVVTRPDTSAKTAHVEHWWEALQAQVSIAGHPLCLFTVCAMEAVQRTFRGSMEAQGQISHLESLTGFNPWAPGSGTNSVPMSLDELSLASRNMGAVMVSLEDYARQVRLLRQAADYVSRSGTDGLALSRSEAANVAAAINLLQQQMVSWEIRIDYLRERAKNQLTVIFNLMTRYDASSSIAIAKSAKKDSASMRAIAIMTMVFLPGTFFAALFAVPSLQWDASPVIGSNFWVYWAFSIPSTLIVFVVWVWMSRETPEPPQNEDTLRGSSSETPCFRDKSRELVSPLSVASLRKRVPRNDRILAGNTDVRV